MLKWRKIFWYYKTSNFEPSEQINCRSYNTFFSHFSEKNVAKFLIVFAFFSRKVLLAGNVIKSYTLAINIFFFRSKKCLKRDIKEVLKDLNPLPPQSGVFYGEGRLVFVTILLLKCMCLGENWQNEYYLLIIVSLTNIVSIVTCIDLL